MENTSLCNLYTRSSKRSSGLSDSGQRLQNILEPHFRVVKRIGEGTFSSVFAVRDEEKNEDIAVKHLIPTVSPDRILTEIESLSLTGGRHNVIPLLFVKRDLGNVILGMPYIPSIKFGELILSMDYEEFKLYFKNLLVAVAYIHTFQIIHRDIKPANFLYDRSRKRFFLCDFGLAQRLCGRERGEKRKMSSSESPRKRLVLASLNYNETQTTPKKRKGRPSMTSEYYDPRGSLLKTPPKSIVQTLKEIQSVQRSHFLRRSPRKHPSSLLSSTKTISKLTISGSTIVGTSSAVAPANKPSFTMLDPASGIPSGETETGTLLQASLTSIHSFGTPLFTAQRFSTPPSSLLQSVERCSCYAKPFVCNKCTRRRSQKAARAGTPGFRPPEVLFKSEYQTTAVDMWAVGVIFLCILSRSYPFFAAPDDVTALAEIMVLFGTDAIREAGSQYGKKFLCSPHTEALDLRQLCVSLSQRSSSSLPCHATDEAMDLLSKILNLLASDRLSAEEALKHSFFK